MSDDTPTIILGADESVWASELDPNLDIDPRVQAQIADEFLDAISDTAEVARSDYDIGSSPAGTFGYLVPKTRIYIRASQIKKSRAALFAGMTAALYTNSSLATTFSAAVAVVWENVKRLDDQDIEMLAKLRRLADGNMYKVWVSRESLVASWPSPDQWDPNAILDKLLDFNVLEEREGRFRAVV